MIDLPARNPGVARHRFVDRMGSATEDRRACEAVEEIAGYQSGRLASWRAAHFWDRFSTSVNCAGPT